MARREWAVVTTVRFESQVGRAPVGVVTALLGFIDRLTDALRRWAQIEDVLEDLGLDSMPPSIEELAPPCRAALLVGDLAIVEIEVDAASYRLILRELI